MVPHGVLNLAHLFAENLNLTLEQHSRQTEQKNLTLDPQTRQRLESLGYIDTGAKYEAYEFDKNKYDPKDFIEFHELRKKFNIHMVRKQYAQAKTVGEKILTQDASDPQLCYKLAAIASMLFIARPPRVRTPGWRAWRRHTRCRCPA